jgi:hypothetical protein
MYKILTTLYPQDELQLIRYLILAAAREVIALQDVQFTGNSAYDDNGRFFVNNPSPVNYQGAGPEVDDAWRNLTLAGRKYPPKK